MPKLFVAGESFNVAVDGAADAPTIVLAHPLGADLTVWERQMPPLLQKFRVVRYDARGHGDSVVSDDPYALERLGRDALAILDALRVQRAHWLGLSMGGVVLQWLLAHAPHRVERAVLANTAARLGPPSAWDARIQAVRQGGVAAVAPAVIERWFTQEFREREPQVARRVFEILRATPALGYAGCAAAMRDADLRQAIKHARNPVLVIVGRRDASTPPDLGRQIAQSIEGARLVALEAAHLSNIEAADAFNRAAIEFLVA